MVICGNVSKVIQNSIYCSNSITWLPTDTAGSLCSSSSRHSHLLSASLICGNSFQCPLLAQSIPAESRTSCFTFLPLVTEPSVADTVDRAHSKPHNQPQENEIRYIITSSAFQMYVDMFWFPVKNVSHCIQLWDWPSVARMTRYQKNNDWLV